MAKKKEVVSGSLDDLKIERSGVGDVNGKDAGSAARFNAGKMRYDLLDLQTLLDSIEYDSDFIPYDDVLASLADWQQGGTSEDLMSAAYALSKATEHQWTPNPSSIGFIPWDQCAEVFEYGAKKYSEWNWMRGQKWSIPLACCLRHLSKISKGEWIDQESGKTHLGHFLCNIMMLCYFERDYQEGDDRPPFLSNKED